MPAATTKNQSEVIDLQEYAKSSNAGSVSVQGINKVGAIQDFINNHL
jgi:hypothetical protein